MSWQIGKSGCVIATFQDDLGARDHQEPKHWACYGGGYLVCESIIDLNTAKLIAAAPDMLDALLAVSRNMKGLHEEDLELAVDRAIAKAT